MAKDTNQRIDRVLRSLPALKAISVQLEGLTELDRSLRGVLPGPLRGQVRVAARDGKVLTLAAANAACAARLRLIRSRLLRALTDVDNSVQDLRVVVEVEQARRGLRREVVPIGDRGRLELAALERELPDGPLRAAVARLASGCAGLNREDQSFEDQEGDD